MRDVKELKKFMKRWTNFYSNNSPFAAPREDELTEQIKNDHVLCYDRYSNGEARHALNGVVIARCLRQKLTLKDFAQRKYSFDAGQTFITDFVFEDLDAFSLAQVIMEIERKFAPVINIEIYAEDFKLIAMLKEHGFHYVMTKVTAYAEIKVVYTTAKRSLFDALDADQPDVEKASLVELRRAYVEPETAEQMRFELENCLAEWKFAEHYSIYNKDSAWAGISIRGYKSDDPSFIEKPSEMSRKWKAENADLLALECTDTQVRPLFLRTMRFLDFHVPAKLERVRILKLSHGSIYRHCDIQDKEAGTADGKLVRLHIPLITNDLVTFNSWDAEGHLIEKKLKANSLYYLDHRKPHAVKNESDEVRIHLVFDVYSNEAIRNLIFQGFLRELSREKKI